MSKYIKLNAAIRILWELGMPLSDYESYAKQLESLPTIDIVHCEDCKHNENTCINHGEMSPRCRYTNYTKFADDFCSYGERSGR